VAVGVGVGLVLVKTERDRRAATRGRRERRPSLLRDESAAAGLRRVILGQLDLAIELLDNYPQRPGGPIAARHIDSLQAADEWTVHEIRKVLKRLRALMRLLRPRLGPKRFARENAALRDCGRRLAGARDAEVMLSTLDALCGRHPAKLAGSRGVERLRAQLRTERDRAAATAIRDPRLRGAVADDLRAVRERVAGWELTLRDAKLVGPGLERLYRQGRRDLRGARRHKDSEALHQWRKRVKDLRYVAETLDRGDRHVHRVARRADRLGETLGEEHDLALLARAVRRRPKHFAGDRPARKTLLKLIARRRAKLRRRALRDGERLYRRRPRAFVRRLRDF
jgi:CHAD domain-containing protein